MLDAVFPVAVLLAVVNKAIVDYLSAPVKQRYPDADLWWLVYVAFVTGMALGLIAGINLFGGIASMPALAGRILTGACIGGGANFLHDVARHRNEQPEPTA